MNMDQLPDDNPAERDQTQALRAAWDKGKASGIAGPFDRAATINRARRKKAAATDRCT